MQNDVTVPVPCGDPAAGVRGELTRLSGGDQPEALELSWQLGIAAPSGIRN
ncbi:hypothetical protein [Planotetraspora sp. GP83]|uniref:hypothetical protein n=1 Tax=Planotetraspora sp. GP83 TaxID=3156264 RepID=UPI0035142748